MNSKGLEALVNSFLAEYRQNKLLLAVSGGVDSMVLANILKKTGFEFGMAHCNYHLRDEQSNLDQQLIENWAVSNNISLHVKSCPISKNSPNIQDSARKLRLAHFNEIKSSYDYNYLVTAHHMEDLIEGFFLNLIRGAGIRGLNTMSRYYKHSLRPLENVKKNEIYDYASFNNILFREDSSNSEDKYARNIIRHQVIPVFKTISSSFFNSAGRSLKLLGEHEALIDFYRSQWKSKNVLFSEAFIKINIIFNEEDYFLFELLADEGFHYNEIQNIKLNLNSPGKEFKSRNDKKLIIDRSCLYILNSKTPSIFEKIIIYNHHDKQIQSNEICVTIKSINIRDFDWNAIGKDPWVIHFDLEHVNFPLIIRHWLDGDKMRPIGMQGKQKKIKQILSDKKSNSAFKKQELVIAYNEEVYCLIGHTIAHQVSITEQTKCILEISFTFEK
ncbi:MAG: tRNA lysidine(34) synthetase TilS [Saprospiraceae bacterium]